MLTIPELNKKVNNLVSLRKKRAELKENLSAKQEELSQQLQPFTGALVELGSEIEQEQEEILQELREAGAKGWKTDQATISRKTTVTYKVVDENKVFAQLKKDKLLTQYAKLTLVPEVKGLFEKKDFDGVEKNEKEFISVLNTKKEDK
ncbi:MAG: hypothetical protein NUV80_04245 [Candidatus Berkelbacteria bacterium]|nr:hypothetical protein [Candidatus Berkelbacteria bacterium]